MSSVTETRRKVKRILLPKEMLETFFVNRDRYEVHGIPDDATLVSNYWDAKRNCLTFAFASDEWEYIEEGEEIPIHEWEVEPINCSNCGNDLTYDQEEDVKYCSVCRMEFNVY